ncbi:replication protein A 70 kDa DNA-binding subunit A-like protein [Tanacetum coccineum]
MPLDLTLRPIRELKTYESARTNPDPVVQVIEVKKTQTHIYKLLLSDGLYYIEAYVNCTLKKSKQLEEGLIVRLDEYLRTSVDNTMVIKVLNIDVIHTQCDIIGNPKPFPYRATPSVEDYYRVSLPPDEHPLLNGLFSLPQRNLNDMSACSEKSEKLEWGTETEDVVDYIHDSLAEDEHPLLTGSCISVEDRLEWGTETEDGFIMLEKSLEY